MGEVPLETFSNLARLLAALLFDDSFRGADLRRPRASGSVLGLSPAVTFPQLSSLE